MLVAVSSSDVGDVAAAVGVDDNAVQVLPKTKKSVTLHSRMGKTKLTFSVAEGIALWCRVCECSGCSTALEDKAYVLVIEPELDKLIVAADLTSRTVCVRLGLYKVTVLSCDMRLLSYTFSNWDALSFNSKAMAKDLSIV